MRCTEADYLLPFINNKEYRISNMFLQSNLSMPGFMITIPLNNLKLFKSEFMSYPLSWLSSSTTTIEK